MQLQEDTFITTLVRNSEVSLDCLKSAIARNDADAAKKFGSYIERNGRLIASHIQGEQDHEQIMAEAYKSVPMPVPAAVLEKATVLFLRWWFIQPFKKRKK